MFFSSIAIVWVIVNKDTSTFYFMYQSNSQSKGNLKVLEVYKQILDNISRGEIYYRERNFLVQEILI